MLDASSTSAVLKFSDEYEVSIKLSSIGTLQPPAFFDFGVGLITAVSGTEMASDSKCSAVLIHPGELVLLFPPQSDIHGGDRACRGSQCFPSNSSTAMKEFPKTTDD
jgi:hypothetical protein